MKYSGLVGYAGICPTCGKHEFPSKKIAKRAARQAHPGVHFSYYRCGTNWHYGHLPSRVLYGDMPRTSIGPRRKARP